MGGGRENDNCVGWKIAITFALHRAPPLRRMEDRAQCLFFQNSSVLSKPDDHVTHDAIWVIINSAVRDLDALFWQQLM